MHPSSFAVTAALLLLNLHSIDADNAQANPTDLCRLAYPPVLWKIFCTGLGSNTALEKFASSMASFDASFDTDAYLGIDTEDLLKSAPVAAMTENNNAAPGAISKINPADSAPLAAAQPKIAPQKTMASGAVMLDGSAEFMARPDGIYYGDTRINIKGITWFGFECENYVVYGLWERTLDEIVADIKALGFNAVRLPFSADVALNIDEWKVKKVDADPRFDGMTVGEAMDLIVNTLTENGILVMPDLHKSTAGGSIEGHWYPEAVGDPARDYIIQAWLNIVTRYKDNPGVFAADLRNEPHSEDGFVPHWKDWMAVVNEMAEAIHAVKPDMMLVVEGTDQMEFTSGKYGTFWGGVVAGALHVTPDPKFMDKVVFSPHVYGPNVYDHEYFQVPEFPDNMPNIWNDHFGGVIGKYPILVGEWGGRYTDREKQITDKMSDYLIDHGIGCMNFFWCLNPESEDTGGLFKSDWKTVETEKLAVLDKTCPDPTKFIYAV